MHYDIIYIGNRDIPKNFRHKSSAFCTAIEEAIMYITVTETKELCFEELKQEVWSGAVDTLKTIEEFNKEDELLDLINEMFTDGIEMTALNDFLWFDDELIFSYLDITLAA